MSSFWSESDALKLKTRREDAGLEAAALAKLFAVSAAQVRELEDGGQDCFYSPVIKAQISLCGRCASRIDMTSRSSIALMAKSAFIPPKSASRALGQCMPNPSTTAVRFGLQLRSGAA